MKRSLIIITCFVLAVLGYGCQKQASSNSGVENSIGSTEANAESKIINTAAPSEQTGSTVIAYYFHRTMRCRTCLAIETNAARVIESKFSQQITDGQLTWMPYNLDDPGGKDLEKEFDVSVSTLVLAKMRNGGHIKHIKLDGVWECIGDPVKFDAYVEDEVRQFLNE